MSKNGPILLIEDDKDDKEIFQLVLKQIGIENEFVWFDNAIGAMEYLKTTQEAVFVIFCDINLPGKNGLDFKRDIDSDPALRRKSIPFIFFTTTASQQNVNEAYTQLSVQGFFKKGTDFNDMKKQVTTIFEYWTECKHPNT